MYVLSRFNTRGRTHRYIIGSLLAIALFFSSAGTLLAGTTGTLSGTVTNQQTGLAIKDVRVYAAAPTGRYTTTTDAQGFFSLTGIQPDTYTVSFESTGYQQYSITGVNVFLDQTTNLQTVTLQKSLVTIGRITTRAVGGAFQGGQTQDTYTVSGAQIDIINGFQFSNSESNIIRSLPGGSLDSSGYPVLRGGRENEEGLSYEGVTVTDAFTNQFTNSLNTNGVAQFRFIPGAGNATVGNAGTGSINYTSKRGTRPAFGSLFLGVGTGPYDHEFGAEYGFMTPDGRISNFIGITGSRTGSQFGPAGTRAVEVLGFNSCCQDVEANNVVENFIYKFGRDNNTELQFLYNSQIVRFGYNYGGGIGTALHYELGDPYFQNNSNSGQLAGIACSGYSGVVGSCAAGGAGYNAMVNVLGSGVLTLLPGQPSLNGLLPQSAQYQPQQLYKVQLSKNFDSSSYMRLAWYGNNAVVPFDLPDPNVLGAYEPQGGLTHGFTLDYNKQLGSHHLLQIGGKFDWQSPIFGVISNDNSFAAVNGFAFGRDPGYELTDFLPPGHTLYGVPTGLLAQFFPGGAIPSIPLYNRAALIPRGVWAGYINDQISVNDRLKMELGLRVDGANVHFPQVFDGYTQTIPAAAAHPAILEPRFAVTFQPSRVDSVRASFGRSVQMPPLADMGRTLDRNAFNAFNNIPSFNSNSATFNPVLLTPVANWCGPTRNVVCKSYADQLYSNYQYWIASQTPIQPVKPETFTNYDFSYSHQFSSNVGMRITPFYTRGYDIVDNFSTIQSFNPVTNAPIFNPAQSTNLGSEFTTGVEFQVTRDAPTGLVGQFAATYINKFSNVPPLSASEDFFPSIPGASLFAGNLYRVGYLSPFSAELDFAYKWKNGLRIGPQITYSRGYPRGNGLLFPTFINGNAVNVPLTDVTGPSVGRNTSQFVDPANPGSLFHPNVAAALGTPEGTAPGARLTNARMFTDLTIEFAPTGAHSAIGVQVTNLFDQLWSRPFLNSRLQPVATGILGPMTGKLASFEFPFYNNPSTPYVSPNALLPYGQKPYLLVPSATPTTLLFYYQMKL